jgi:hypothetical protein
LGYISKKQRSKVLGMATKVFRRVDWLVIYSILILRYNRQQSASAAKRSRCFCQLI